MPYHVRDLPSITFSSGATISPASVGLDDANAIGIFTPTSTSGLTVQVAWTDTSTFVTLRHDSSGASAVILTTGGALQITPVTFRQIRVTATAAVNADVTVSLTKQIVV